MQFDSQAPSWPIDESSLSQNGGRVHSTAQGVDAWRGGGSVHILFCYLSSPSLFRFRIRPYSFFTHI